MIVDRYIGWKFRRDPDAYLQLHADMVAARMGITVHRFITLCMLSAMAAGLAVGFAGMLIASLVYIPSVSIQIYNVFNIHIPSYYVPALDRLTFSILVFILLFAITTFVANRLMLGYPSIKKSARVIKINMSIHNAVSYMYAMRRGGAEMLDIFRSLSDNSAVYGEVAMEFRQVLRDADYFGYDLISALDNLSMTTPSDKLKDFVEDLVSVLGSGGNVSSYLEGRVRLYQEEARFEQLQFLSTLQLIAESYVTVFVAGPLFLVIIMVVFGMIGTSASLQMSIITYFGLPIGAIMFILFIDMMTIPEEAVERYTRMIEMKQFEDVKIEDVPDDEKNFKALDKYDRRKSIRNFINSPLNWFIIDTNRSLYFTVPIAIIYVVVLLFVTPVYTNMETYYDVIDDHFVIAALIIILPYALFYELWRRKLRGVESSIPEFLDRLSSINRVGLTLAGAINILVRANLGLISYEIRRIKRDLDWGASINEALVRFEQRVNTAVIARTVTLITKASEMSGEIGEVLGIASGDARMSETLKKERRGEMFIYTVIIYLSFFVFIFVVAVLNTNFLDSIAAMASTTTGDVSSVAGSAAFTQTSNMNVDEFRRLLYHTCLIQAFFSGIIAGQMGEGSIKAGIKHVGIMLLIALIIFNLLI